MIKMKKVVLSFMIVCLLLFIIPFTLAEYNETDSVCAIYFTGKGCSHCAKVNPIIDEMLEKYPNHVFIKYEVFENKENAPIIQSYADTYGFRPGVPVLIINSNTILQGDFPILKDVDAKLCSLESNPCALIDGSSVDYSELNISTLPGKPEILKGSDVIVGGGNATCESQELTFAKIISLAAVDAVNPCAIAVLVLLLISIMTYNPKKKSKVLLAGLAFCLSIFVMYLVYGLIIVKFFQLVQVLSGVRLWIYKILGVAAIVLGILNIRDFFNYRPGRAGTEMPLMLRPKMKKMMSRVTSPGGAFIVGLFVTLFLLPCTIGPYIIAGGILSTLEFLSTLPWLLLYNLIFILPMLIITFIVYGGLTSVEKVGGWKDKNIKWLHLIAGIIMALLGIAMVVGWV